MSATGDRLAEVRDAIAKAADRAERDPATVTLVAVSKTWPADVVMEAIAAGVTDLGENRAQEFKEKVALLGEVAHWHFVGNLQTNKVRQVVGACALIHSVDRVGLAEAVSRRATSSGLVQDVLVEVNIARDPSKHGIEPERAVALARSIDALPGVRLRGLMTMPPYPDDPEESRPLYRGLAELARQVVAEAPNATHLSMGMSRDFGVAIEEGATMVRVGTAVFGARRGR